MKSHAIRFVVAGLLSVLVILLHESSHYAMAGAFGFERHFHFGRVDVPPHQFQSAWQFLLVVAAGPAVDAFFMLCGFLWLRRLRRDRAGVAASPLEWLATFGALGATRWFRCFAGTPAHPNPRDEAMISGVLGLPEWVLPYALAPLALAVVIATIRLHPPGQRLVAFSSVFAGIIAWRFLWMEWLGPRLIP